MANQLKWNYAAGGQLLKSAEIQADLLRRAQAIAATAGDGFVADGSVGKTRARATARSVTFQAAKSEAKDRTLLRAVDAARG